MHLFYSMFFLFADPFTQPLYHVPHTAGTDALAAGAAYCLCCNAVRRFCYRHGQLLCQVCGDQAYLFHLHGFIQQIHTGFLSILKFCLIDVPAIADFTVDCFYRGGADPFIPVILFIPSLCQFLIISLQHGSCDLSAQLTYIRKYFLLQLLERYRFFLYNSFHHTVSFTCFS